VLLPLCWNIFFSFRNGGGGVRWRVLLVAGGVGTVFI